MKVLRISKIILFLFLFLSLSSSVLLAGVKINLFKAASPQYIEGDRLINYTIIISDDSTSNVAFPLPITIIDKLDDDGNFTNADINITNDGGFDCTRNTANTSSDIVCTGDINHSGAIQYINYTVLAPDRPMQLTNEVTVFQSDDLDDPIATASVTVTVFPNYDNALDYERDLCYIPSFNDETCRQSGAFFYGEDCHTSVIVKRNPNTDPDIGTRHLTNLHVFKAYTSDINSDNCYTDITGAPVTCGNEQDIEDLLNKDSSLYLELAFSEAHDFSLGDFDTSSTDENRTLVDINTEPSSNQESFFEYIALIAQYNIYETDETYDEADTIEEYIYPCDGNYSTPVIVIQQTGVGLNNVKMVAGNTLEDQAEYIDYTTFSKVGTKIVKEPFVVGVTYLDTDGNPATYDGTWADGKTINAPILLQYEKHDGTIENLWSGELEHNQEHVLTLENFANDSNTLASYPMIAEAYRSAKIQTRIIDYGAFFTAVDGLSCGASSLDSSLCLLPGCLNSAEQITRVFPIENYPHVAQCVYGDGGGAAPCDSNAYYGSCGGIKIPVSPDKYNHDLGCMHCLADAITPDLYSNSFSVRPKEFSLEVPNLVGDLYRAGTPYPIDLNATTADPTDTTSDAYNTTLEGYTPSKVIAVIGLEEDLSLTCPYDVNESQTIIFNDGYSGSPISYSNVGKVKLVIMDQNWTSVDQDPSIYSIDRCIVGSTESDPIGDLYGRVGCKLIAEQNMTFIPHHFNIDANLTDHNSDNNFTYLHDINRYDGDDNYEMGAQLTVGIQAMTADNNVTTNYIETCYAKDTNLTLNLGGTNITFPGTEAIEHFLYYNPLEDDGTTADSGEGNYSFPTPVTSPISITSLPIENIKTSFPSDAPDGNGTTHIEYKLNFDRKEHLVVNPFQIILNDVNITEIDDNLTTSDLATGDTGGLSDQNATMYYARTRASKFFYEDITTANVPTPILVDIYCDLGFSACDTLGIDTVNGALKDNNPEWWVSVNHNETTQNDGNITLIINLPGAIIEGTTTDNPTVVTDVTVDTQGQDATISVSSNTNDLPMTVIIDLDESSPSDTNHWLIYNPDTDSILRETPSPFYKVRFISDSNWTGTGNTGDVVNINSSRKKSQRMDW